MGGQGLQITLGKPVKRALRLSDQLPDCAAALNGLTCEETMLKVAVGVPSRRTTTLCTPVHPAPHSFLHRGRPAWTPAAGLRSTAG
jgi:hypothetical protein